jgi:hypothetical protein
LDGALGTVESITDCHVSKLLQEVAVAQDAGLFEKASFKGNTVPPDIQKTLYSTRQRLMDTMSNHLISVHKIQNKKRK